jgi:hypothetical protein
MSDFSVSMGCGDYPTNDLSEDRPSVGYEETEEEIQEMLAKGFIKDSTGSWYDPTNYIDCYYADW